MLVLPFAQFFIAAPRQAVSDITILTNQAGILFQQPTFLFKFIVRPGLRLANCRVAR
jgi:hypothetical protein